jgi:hypothetical protein
VGRGETLRIRATGVLGSVMLLAAWSCARPPADSEVQAAFTKENANAVVTNITSTYPMKPPGEQGGDIVEKQIRFRPAAMWVECEVVWTYTDGEPEWLLTSKSEPSCRAAEQ